VSQEGNGKAKAQDGELLPVLTSRLLGQPGFTAQQTATTSISFEQKRSSPAPSSRLLVCSQLPKHHVRENLTHQAKPFD